MNLKNTIISKKEALRMLRDIGAIDPHIHARDMNEWPKFTNKKSRNLMRFYGIKFGGFMPNTSPTITDEETLLRYLEIAKKSDRTDVRFMIWFGLTSNPEQIKEAVRLYNKYEKVIIGFKMYAGKTTGDLELITREQQKIVYQTLAELKHKGVVALHCEEESLTDFKKFDPERPETWAKARPEIAETFSISQQIELIKEVDFAGWLHICHISTIESVAIVNEAKRDGMRISCGATPHHLICSVEQMEKMEQIEAMAWKCNPPIRTENNRQGLIKALEDGKIDLVESDNAPHTKRDKVLKYASGVRSIPMLPDLIIELKACGFSDQRIEEVLRNKSLEIFKRIQNVI